VAYKRTYCKTCDNDTFNYSNNDCIICFQNKLPPPFTLQDELNYIKEYALSHWVSDEMWYELEKELNEKRNLLL